MGAKVLRNLEYLAAKHMADTVLIFHETGIAITVLTNEYIEMDISAAEDLLQQLKG